MGDTTLNENVEIPERELKYNIPVETMNEGVQRQIPTTHQTPTPDKILNSKLPDEIKKLMIEHPIHQPQNSGPVLSDDLVEKASRLMNTDASGKQITENIKKNINNLYQTLPKTDTNDLKAIIRETMEEVLKENGLLIESVNKTNQSEVFTFKVGKHIFEGKVTKIKKVQ